MCSGISTFGVKICGSKKVLGSGNQLLTLVISFSFVFW